MSRVYLGLVPSSSAGAIVNDGALPNVGLALLTSSFGQTLVYENGAPTSAFPFQAGDNFGIYVARDRHVRFTVNGRDAGTSTAVVEGPHHLTIAIQDPGVVLTSFAWLEKDAWCALPAAVTCAERSCHTRLGDAGCVQGECVYDYHGDGASCDDGDSSTISDTCQAGACAGTAPCSSMICEAVSDCHPNPTCLYGQCYAGPAAADGTLCDDNVIETAQSVCQAGVCVGVIPTVAATHAPETEVPGTVGAFCADAATDCPASRGPCYDPFVCTRGMCLGGVDLLADNTACEDGDADTINDQCTAGVCAGVGRCDGVVCDGDPGTCQVSLGCDSATGECRTADAPRGTNCDDGNDRTHGDRCFSGVCTGNDPCVNFDCSIVRQAQCRLVGVCYAHSAFQPGCTSVIAPAGSSCNDFDITTRDDVCDDDGFCFGVSKCHDVTCTTSNQCSVAGSCIARSGQCSADTHLASGTSCNDGNVNTIDDVCDGQGRCVGDDQCGDVECPAPAPCVTASACVAGICITGDEMEDEEACDDGDPETEDDMCFGGACSGIHMCSRVVCTDSTNQCEEPVGQCSYGACVYTPLAAGTSCDDGNNWTTSDQCSGPETDTVVGLQCAGEDLCEVNNVTCPDPPACRSEANCYQGLCPAIEDFPVLNDEVEPGIARTCEIADWAGDHDAIPEGAEFNCRSGDCVPQDNCDGVFCPATDLCSLAPECLVGHPEETRCSGPSVPAHLGTPCDDANDRTLFDRCEEVTADNTTSVHCVGNDPCTDVVCAVPDQCHGAVECAWPSGFCPDLPILADASCDDGSDLTEDDACSATAECIGIDRCIENEVECEERPCHTSEGCLHGNCLYNRHPEGEVCDDGDGSTSEYRQLLFHVTAVVTLTKRSPLQSRAASSRPLNVPLCFNLFSSMCHPLFSTAGDVCSAGLCFGVPNQLVCHTAVDCSDSGCVQEPVQDGTTCVDGNPLTYGDFCFDGTCIGPLPCPVEQGCVSWARRIGIQETNDYGLRRIQDGNSWTAIAHSTETVDWSATGAGDGLVGIEFRPVQVDRTFVVGFTADSDANLFGDAEWSVLLNYHGQINVLANGLLHQNIGDYRTSDRIAIRIGARDTFEVLQNDDLVFSVPWTTRTGRAFYVLVNLHDHGAQADSFRWITTDATCEGVTCVWDESNVCLGEPSCELGSCVAPNINQGVACDDDDSATDDDHCDRGVCTGTNHCADVTCPEASSCQDRVQCEHGQCIGYGSSSLEGDACDDGNLNTENDVCTLSGDCIGEDQCITGPGCAPPDIGRCQGSVECFRGHCFYEAMAAGESCNDGSSATRNDQCGGEIDTCVGERLQCTAQADGSISFAAACGDANESTLLSSASPFSWRYVANSGDTTGCVCRTTYGGIRFVATTASSTLELTDSQCSRLICTNENFKFQQCSNNGQRVSDGTWGIDNTVGVAATFEDTVCVESGTVSDNIPGGPADTTPEPPASSCPRGDCHIVMNPRATAAEDCSITVNQVVTWEWENAGLNVLSVDGQFPGSGNPQLNGCYSHTFESVGSFDYRAQQFTNVVGTVAVGRSAVVDNTAVPDRTINWEPEYYSSNFEITVCVGDFVRFRWRSQAEDVSVRSGHPSSSVVGQLFDSEPGSDGSVTVVFLAEGNFPIFDGVHPWLTATVEVGSCPTGVAQTTEASSQNEACIERGTSLVESTQQFQGTDAIFAHVPTVGRSFSVLATFTASAGGYVFAKSSRGGARYYSLYLSRLSSKVYFYYRVAGSSSQKAASFNFRLTDGVEYTVLLTVEGTELTLHAYSSIFDFGSSRKRLSGSVQDCDSDGPDCVFVLGARSDDASGGPLPVMNQLLSGSGTGSTPITHWGFEGSISSLTVYYDCLLEGVDIGATVLPTEGFPSGEPGACFDFFAHQQTSSNFGDLLAADGSLTFDGSAGLRLTSFPSNVRSAWSVAMTVTQNPGSFGYLFAKTDGSGSRRYYALYSRSSTASRTAKMVFYYSAVVNGEVVPARKTFDNIDIADGAPHEVLFIVVRNLAVVQVDGTNYVPSDGQPLISSQVEDCGAPSIDCIYRVGARSSSSSLGESYQFEGTMHYASQCSNDARLGLYPAAGSPSVQHLLRHASHPNETVYEVAEFQPLSAVSGFSVYFDVAIQPGTSGYLIAKTSSDGGLRHFAVYVRSSASSGDEVRVYYTPSGSDSHSVLTFRSVALADGARHEVMVTIQGSAVTLSIDAYRGEQSMTGALEDCASEGGDCVLNLGRRASQTGLNGYPIESAMYEALIHYGRALTTFP